MESYRLIGWMAVLLHLEVICGQMNIANILILIKVSHIVLLAISVNNNV